MERLKDIGRIKKAVAFVSTLVEIYRDEGTRGMKN
jgi:hypothetical protein